MKALLYLNVRLFKNMVLTTIKNPKQILPALFIFFFLLFPLITIRTLDIPPMIPSYTTETVKPVIFSFLTFITWMTVIHSATKNTLIFSLSEIDFLFPSPLKRKTILLNRILISYLKMTAQYLGIAGFALFMLSSFYQFVFWPRILFLWLAITLAMVFASNLGSMVSLVSSHFSELKRSRNRNILLGAFACFIGIIAVYTYMYVREGVPLLEAGARALNSSLVRVLMYPLAAASDVAVAWTLTGDVALKLGVLTTLCIVTVWGILSVETHFYEASEATSKELWESLQKMQRQEVVVSESFVKRMFKIQPFGRGATVLVWKNLIGMVRDIRTLLPTVFMALFLFVLMFIREDDPQFFSALFFLFFLIFVTTGYIRWDFREDLRRIEIIKLIPDSNFKIVLSEIAVPAIFSTIIAYVFLAASFFVFPDSESKLLLAGFSVIALPLFSVIMVTISNLSALYYPPQTNNQVVPGIMGMLVTVVVLSPSIVVGVMFMILEKIFVGLVVALFLNGGVALVLLKLLARKYRFFDLTST
jgi:hypothetical protein